MNINFKKLTKLVVILTSGVILFGCNQADSGVKNAEQLKADLMKEIPGIKSIDAINKSKIDNIDEVVVGRKVFYVTSDGKYLIFGNIIDPVNKKNLTEDRTAELSTVDWSKLPLDLAIKEVNGNGERKIAVFSDPDCPYCQMFEKQVVPNLKDTTVYTFLFPLPIHQNARRDSENIWCNKDRLATWVNWMRNKIDIPAVPNCDVSQLDTIYKVGTDEVQVEGTPTIILSNGQILSGVVPADQLIAKMDEVAAKK
jgi:thiol:disulfide interchange protein DsbC